MVVPANANPEVTEDGVEALARRIRLLAGGRVRVLVGLTGAPGAGKTTLADALVSELGPTAVAVPMDGFHLAGSVLAAEDLVEVKGAPHTFDGYGYLALLRRLRQPGANEIVYAPAFSRTVEEPIGSAIPVPGSMRYVITEGNYLLMAAEPWALVPDLLDAVWFLEAPQDIRINRLTRRHIQFGRTPMEALKRATAGSDADNAELIAATKPRADLIVLT